MCFFLNFFISVGFFFLYFCLHYFGTINYYNCYRLSSDTVDCVRKAKTSTTNFFCRLCWKSRRWPSKRSRPSRTCGGSSPLPLAPPDKTFRPNLIILYNDTNTYYTNIIIMWCQNRVKCHTRHYDAPLFVYFHAIPAWVLNIYT